MLKDEYIVLKHQMYLLEQHSESFGRQLYWIYIDGISMIMKLGPGYHFTKALTQNFI